MVAPTMSHDPITFLKETFPTLHQKGMALLEEKAAGGSNLAKSMLANCTPVVGQARLDFPGRGTVYVLVKEGKVEVGDAAFEGVKTNVAAEVPPDAAEVVLGEAMQESALDDEKLLMGLTQVGSAELEKALAGRALTCHLVIADAPDLGDVTVKIGFNVAEPPASPQFTARLVYDDLEDLRAGDINAQQLFMGGKMRMTGDYSIAMQVGMQLAMRAQQLKAQG
jgi:putative sterol carrier protein